jgi:hypothetical protein
MRDSEKQEPSQDGPMLSDNFQESVDTADQASHTSDQGGLTPEQEDRKRLFVLCGSALMQLPLWGKACLCSKSLLALTNRLLLELWCS